MSAFRGVIKGKVTLSDSPIDGAIVKCIEDAPYFYGNVGGEVVEYGDYMLHIFKTAGEAQVFTACKNGKTDVLTVAGGASGGASVGGAGGAGGLVFSPNHLVLQGVYPVLVGAGGAEQTVRNAVGNPGLDSEFDTLVADGGGGGGSYPITGVGLSGASGGCGGSAGGSDGGSPTAGTGTQGGDGGARYPQYITGGGGGMGGNGQDGVSGRAGDGGPGIAEIEIDGVVYNFKELFGTSVGFIEGEEIYFCGGGGGVAHNEVSGNGRHGGGSGAISGGGSGGSGSTVPGAGIQNTGGGGGGGASGINRGGAGGSGIVIIRCKTADFLTAVTYEQTTDASGDYIFFDLTNKKHHVTVEYEDLDVPSGQDGIKYNTLSHWAIEPIPRLATAENLLSTPGALGSGEIDCDWDAVTSATLYEIEIATDADFTTIIDSDTSITNTYTFEGLSDDTPYYWRVRSSATNYYTSEWAYADVTEIE